MWEKRQRLFCACKCGIVDCGVIAVCGIVNGADNISAELFCDEVLYLLALECGDECLYFGLAFIAFLDGKYIGICGIGAFYCNGILGGIETCGDSVVGIDDRIVDIAQNIGELSRFYFAEFDIVGVFGYILYRSGDAGALFELDDTVCFENPESSCFVCRVVGDGYCYAFLSACRKARSAAVKSASTSTAEIILFILVIPFVFV